MWRSLLMLMAGGLALAAPVLAGSILYSTSFESPAFTTGPVDGQNGWYNISVGNPQVENTFAYSGSQAVEVSGAVTGQSGPYYNLVSKGPLIDMSAEIALFGSNSQTEWQFSALDPFFPAFLGGIDILPAGGVLAITDGLPLIGTFNRATVFNRSAWHKVDLLFDVPTQTYNISIDGVTLASNLAFCGDVINCMSKATVTTYGMGVFDTFGGGNDVGYLDGYSVSLVSGVPEPSSTVMVLVFLGLAAIFKVCRRSCA